MSVPIPKITASLLRPRFEHESFHVADSSTQTVENSSRNNRVTNVQFHHLIDSRDRFYVLVVQTVSGIDHKPLLATVACCFDNASQLRALLVASRIGIATGVQFD